MFKCTHLCNFKELKKEMWFLCGQEFKEDMQKHKKEIRQQEGKSDLTV